MTYANFHSGSHLSDQTNYRSCKAHIFILQTCHLFSFHFLGRSWFGTFSTRQCSAVVWTEEKAGKQAGKDYYSSWKAFKAAEKKTCIQLSQVAEHCSCFSPLIYFVLMLFSNFWIIKCSWSWVIGPWYYVTCVLWGKLVLNRIFAEDSQEWMIRT